MNSGALSFVSTSVLSSSDGLEFNDEKRLDTEETREAERLARQREARPLYEQLQEQRDKRQEEHDARTKLIFAPPKAMDEEDEAHYDAIADRQREKRQRMERQDKADSDAFAVARANQVTQIMQETGVSATDREVSSSSSSGHPTGESVGGPQAAGGGDCGLFSNKSQAELLSGLVVARSKSGKRKKSDGGGGAKKKKTAKKKDDRRSEEGEKKAKKASASVLSLLGNYGSDSDDDSG